MSSYAAALIVALSILISTASRADVAWPPNGLQLSNPIHHGALPRVLRDGKGGCYVVWRDRTGCCGTTVVQRLDLTGAVAAGWPTHGVQIPPNEYQELHSIHTDGSGGILVVMLEFSVAGCQHVCVEYAFRIRIARLTASGSTAAGWPSQGRAVVWLGDVRRVFAATSDLNGGLVLATEGGYVHRFDGTGSWSWATPACTLATEERFQTVVPDGSGGVIVAWQDGRYGHNLAGIHAIRIMADGTIAPGWQPNGTPLAPRQNPQQIYPFAAPDGSGGAIVMWGDYRNGFSWYDLYAQHVMADGEIYPGWPAEGVPICVGPQFKRLVGVVSDDAGGAIAGWVDGRYAPNPTGGGDFFAQRVSAGGTPSWALDGVRLSPGGGVVNDIGASLDPDGAGGAHAVWAFNAPSTYLDITAGHVLAGGSLDPSWPMAGLPVCVQDSDQLYPVVGWDGGNGAIVAWQDRRNGTDQVFAQRVTSDAIVPVLVQLVTASATPAGVRLTWFGSQTGDSRVTVHRNAGTGYLPVAEASVDGLGRIEYEDRDVVAGARYGYRLALIRAGVETLSAETWIDVPGAAALALDRVWPNPSHGNVQVSLGLASDAPAALEVFDLAGRRVATREIHPLGAGRHVLALPEATRLAAGRYTIRLTQQRQSLIHPLVIAR